RRSCRSAARHTRPFRRPREQPPHPPRPRAGLLADTARKWSRRPGTTSAPSRGVPARSRAPTGGEARRHPSARTTDAESRPPLLETWRTSARSRRSEERADALQAALDPRDDLDSLHATAPPSPLRRVVEVELPPGLD